MKTVLPAKGLKGEVCVPGDKSISHRSVMLGAIAEGDTYVRGFLKSADCLATIDCFRRMGIEIEERADDGSVFPGSAGEKILIVHGKGLRGLRPLPDDEGHIPDSVELDAMNSGTTVRLMSGILAGQNFTSRITGDASLKKRPMNRIIKPLSQMGIKVTSEHNDGRLPITVYGGMPHATHYTSPVASAQVKSCVLLAGLYADEPTSLTEPTLSRNHTELMLRAFGGRVETSVDPETHSATSTVYPGTPLVGQEISVPGDISSAAYFLAAGLIVPDSEITCTNVGINPTRDGILHVIRDMGGTLEVHNERTEGAEPVADLTVRTSSLRGCEIGGALIPTLIDEIPAIAVMAACASGDTVIRDAAELKVKETNRIAEIVRDLTLMGVSVEETDDGMIIHGRGGAPLRGASIDPHGDHRMAMAFSVAGLAASSPVTITDDACVAVSYPTFYDDLASCVS